jgi:PAS domain S-box-containing protein
MMDKLDDGERRLRLALETAALGVWEWSIVTGKITGSPHCAQLFGLNSGKFPRTYGRLLAKVHADDRLDLEKAIAQGQATGDAWDKDYRVLHPDGSVHWLHSTGRFFLDEAGQAIEMIAITRAIAPGDEKSQRMSIALTHAIEGISFLDKEGRYREVNQAYANIVGYCTEEMIGMDWRHTVHQDDRSRMEAVYGQMLQEGKASAQAKGLRKDGTIFYKETTLVRAGNGRAIGHYCFIKDISTAKRLEEERSQAKKTLQAANDRLQYLLSASPVVIFTSPLANPGQQTSYVSDNVENVLGYSSQEFLSTPRFWFDRVHPDDRPRVIEGGGDAIARGDTHYTYEYRFLHGDGTYHWLHEETRLLQDENGQAIEMIGCFLDVSDRVRAESSLRSTSERLQYILSATPAVIFTCKVEGDYGTTYISDNIEEVLGYQPSQFIEDTSFWLSIVHPEDRQRIFSENTTIFETGHLVQQFRYRHANGDYIWVYEQLRLVCDDKGEPIEIVGYLIDISDRVQMETQLQSSLEEKERLLREVHHRVKNNLHVVTNLLDLQSDYIEDGKSLNLFADNQNRIQSMALIHEQLYQSIDSRQLDMKKYLDRLAGSLFYSYQESQPNLQIAVETEPLHLNLETAVPCGLLINEFVTNCLRHAFKDDRPSRITIRLVRASGEQLQLSVADNGVGFPGELDWQKSPTFGMRLVRILSKQLKAKITLDNRVGTVFTVIFRQLSY